MAILSPPQLQEQGQKNYHRHTPSQIQALEAAFMQCSHPDETQRAMLGRDLGLEPRKVKYWFQNRRTQKKMQQERQDNDILRAENNRIRCENIALRDALQNAVCPSCGPPVAEDYYDEQQLRVENARLKEELADLTYKPLGSSFTQMTQGTPQMSVSPLDLSMATVQMGGHHQQFGGAGLSLDLDLSRAGMFEGCRQEDWGAHFSTNRQ
ncbi:hypothetical protein ZWY2020_001306 [Hordeum vulgare]|nr:hypothetical protein ZWY2020_001306 [Hordeum vulgare]